MTKAKRVQKNLRKVLADCTLGMEVGIYFAPIITKIKEIEDERERKWDHQFWVQPIGCPRSWWYHSCIVGLPSYRQIFLTLGLAFSLFM